MIPQRLESIWQAIHQNRANFGEKARQIMKDENLTPLARRKQVRELHQQAVEKHESLLRQWKNELDTFRQSLVRTTLKPRSDGERQLYLQVQKLTGEDWDNFVQSALSVQDEPTLRAAALTAFVRGDWRTFEKTAQAVAGVSDMLEFERTFGEIADPQAKFALQVELSKPTLPAEFE